MDPGTALAITSLTLQTLVGCVKAFQLITSAGNLGRDATIERTKLLLQEYRLVEWAKAARLDAEPDNRPSSINTNLAALLLGQLERTLSSVDELKKRYKLDLVEKDEQSTELQNRSLQLDQPGHDSIHSVLTTIIPPRTRSNISVWTSRVQKSNTVTKRLWWAAVDKKSFAHFVTDVTVMVDGLWLLLDTASRRHAVHEMNSGLMTAVQSSENSDVLKDIQGALQDNGNGVTLAGTISASASIRATLLTIPSQPPPAKALTLDSAQVSVAERLEGSHLAIGRLGTQRVLIEDKHVSHKLKTKLKTRVTELASLLSRAESPTLLTLPCVGYTEEPFGFRLIFSLPDSATKSVSLLHMLNNPKTKLPSAGARLSLVLDISKTVLAFHAAGWLHKDIRSENIILFPTALVEPYPSQPDLATLQPRLCNFSFARRDNPTEISDLLSTSPDKDIYRHPKALGDVSTGFTRQMDAYALGCVLVEIAEWAPLSKIVRKKIDVSDSNGVKETDIATLPAWLRKRYVDDHSAGFRLGVAFEKMMRLCFADEGEIGIDKYLEVLEELENCRI